MGRKCHEGIKCLIYIGWMDRWAKKKTIATIKHTHTFSEMRIGRSAKENEKKRIRIIETLTIETTKLKY